FSLGAWLAGFAGVIGGPILSVYPGLDQEMLPLALVVVILGGSGSLLGSLVGSFVVGFLYNFGQAMFPELAYVVLFLPMLIVVVALRGTGLGFVMITVALGQIVWGVAYRWISITNGDNGIAIRGRPSPLAISLASPAAFYEATLVVFLIAVASMAVFVASPFG